MRKLLFIMAAIALQSCSEPKQVTAVKEKYSNLKKDTEIEYEVEETTDRTAWELLYKHYDKNYDIYSMDNAEAWDILKKKDKALKEKSKSTGKTFYIVHAIKVVAKDTLKNSYYIVNDKNEPVAHFSGK